MLPTLKQRALIAGATLIAGLLFLQAAGIAAATNGWSGLTLFYNDTPLIACVVVVAMIVVAVVVGLLPAAAGHPYSGMFLVCGALLFAVAGGGKADGWILSADLPGSYLGLAIETVVWAGLLFVAMVAFACLSGQVRKVLPAWLSSPTNDESPHLPQTAEIVPQILGIAIGVAAAGVGFVLTEWMGMPLTLRYLVAVAFGFVVGGGVGIGLTEKLKKQSVNGKKTRYITLPRFSDELVSGGVTVGVGLMLCPLLLRVSDLGQVLCGLFLVFLVGGVLAGYLCPTRRGWGVILAPMAVGMIGYLVAWGGGMEKAVVLSRVFDQYHFDLIKLTLALPAMYASAGGLGALCGLAWAQAMRVSEAEAEERISVDVIETGE